MKFQSGILDKGVKIICYRRETRTPFVCDFNYASVVLL